MSESSSSAGPKTARAALALFEQILDAPEAERERLLEEGCGPNDEVRKAVVELLEADGLSLHWLDRPPVTALKEVLDDELAERWIGRSLGPYRLTEKIGQGGMGVVFLGEREDAAFAKRVAVKILSTTAAGASLRFRRERQILADLEHPGIARLLDGGTTPDGLQYVVMEYVDGEPLHTFCARHRPDLEARLTLFLEICDTVRFAHRNLIVHRDLKPSNILVSAEGRTTLLDFGIAKLLDAPRAEDATRAEDRVLTPAYASPEQIAGAAITTASDVYSLGVVLYELLTGIRPFKRRNTTPSTEVDRPRSSLSNPPKAPSRAAAESAESPIAPQLLRGDLDNILLKALRHDPADRYLSVDRLMTDLENHRNGRVVEARPSSFAYRAAKFARRNTLTLGLSAAALSALVGFSVLTLVQSQNIKQERDAKTEALSILTTSLARADPEENLGRTDTIQDLVERVAARIGPGSEVPDELRADLATSLGRIQLSHGRIEEARERFQQALEASERLHGPRDPRLASNYVDLAEALVRMAAYSRSEELAKQALELAGDESPTERIRALSILAEARAGASAWGEAATLHEQAVELAREKLTPDDPLLLETLRIAALRLRSNRHFERSRELVEEGLDLQRRYRPGDQVETARLLTLSGRDSLSRGRLGDARAALNAALEMHLRIYGERHPAVARSWAYLADLERQEGGIARALELVERSLGIFEASLGESHPETIGARERYAGFLHSELQDPERAEPIYRRAVADFESIEGSESNPNMGRLLSAYGSVLADLGRHVEAVPIWSRSRALWVRIGYGYSTAGVEAQLGLAAALQGAGNFIEAREVLEACWHKAIEEDDLEDPLSRRAGDSLAALYRREGREADAASIERMLSEAGVSSDDG